MRRTLFLLPIQLILLAACPAMAASQSGSVTMAFDLSAQASDKETRLWIPYPISNAHQDITQITISGDFAESAVYSERTHGTPMLFARWDEGSKSRHLTFTFQVDRQEVVHRDFPAVEAAWNQADFARFLAPTSLGPIDGQVKLLADEITAGKTTVLTKAKAIYDWICEHMYRDPEAKGCGPGDVCLLLAKPGGKCTDIHSVFVALCRAAGVPAREVFGIRQGKDSVVDITTWQHCWAEFYLPGYGWVPVDPADVLKMMLVHNLSLTDAQAKEYRAYYWGAWDQYRVEYAHGRDLVLNPAQQGPPLNTFGYPYAEVGDTVLDWLDPKSFAYSITYRQLPARASSGR